MPKITKRLVDSLVAGSHQKITWDSQLKGFGVLVNVSGSKSYVVRYRTREGRDRRMVLGAHGLLTPDQARAKAGKALRDALEGGDPLGDRKAVRAASTVKALVDRFFAEELPKKKPSTATEYRRVLDKHVLPVIGSMKVTSVTTSDISAIHRDLQGTPVMANRVLATIRALFNVAERWDERPRGTNPAVHIDRFREEARELFLTEEQYQALGEAFGTVERESALYWLQVQALRVIALTGARRSEVLGLRREWIDWKRGVAWLPDSKTGAKPLRLGSDALEVLRGIPECSEFFFPSRTKPDAAMHDTRKTWVRVLEVAELPSDLRIHDLRHSKASLGAAQGMSLQMIGALLGHRSTASTARYAHLVDDHIREAENAVQGAIGGALRGGE